MDPRVRGDDSCCVARSAPSQDQTPPEDGANAACGNMS